MATFIEYELEDGSTVLIEGDEPAGAVVQAGLMDGILVKKVEKRFEDAIASIKPWARALHQELHDLGPDEFEVKFGIKVVGEAGNMAVGKLGADFNYEVTLKWKKP